jgi:hypothetical protein
VDKLAAVFTLGLIFAMALASGFLVVSTIFHMIDEIMRVM